MLNQTYRIQQFLAAVFLALFLTACEEERILFPDEYSFAAFEDPTGTISENTSSILKIPVYLASRPGSPFEINFEFQQDSLDNPAVEGEDFILLNESKSLKFEMGTGYDTIRIQTINNEARDRDKLLLIHLSEHESIDIGLNNDYYSYLVTISDDEHPLSLLLGSYDVLAKSVWGSGLDQNYQSIIKAHPDDETKLIIEGIIDGVTEEVEAEVDLEEGIIYVHPGQNLGELEYGPMQLVNGEIANDQIYLLNEPIEGFFDESGDFLMDYWGATITGGQYKDYYYNFYYTTEWTKTE